MMKTGLWATVGIKLLVTVFLIAVVLHQVSFTEVAAYLSSADISYGLASCLTLPPVVMLSAWRWHILADGLISYSRALHYTWIWLFYAHVLPGAITSDLAKGLSLAMKEKDVRVAALPASIIADRFLGLFALLLFVDIACAVLYFSYGLTLSALNAIACVAVLLTVTVVIAFPLLARMLRRAGHFRNRSLADGWLLKNLGSLSGVLASYFQAEWVGRLLAALCLSLAVHTLNAIGLFFGYRAIGGEGSALVVLFAYPVITLIFLVPISIAGIGLRELSLAPVFHLFGQNAASAVALSWINLAAAIPCIAIGVVLQVREIYRK